MKKLTTNSSAKLAKDPQRILAHPYARRFVPDPEGGFIGTIHEFPGLIAEGDSLAETADRLESAAESWLEAQLEAGQTIKPPVDFFGYSGKIALRLPRGLHKQAAELAELEGTSLNQLLVAAIGAYVGGLGLAHSFAHDIAVRAERYSPAVTTIFVTDRRQLSNRETVSISDFKRLAPASFVSNLLEVNCNA